MRLPGRLSFLLAFVACAASMTASMGCTQSEREKRAASQKAGELSPPTGPQPGGHIKLPSNEPRYLNPVLETRFDRANMLIFEGLVGLDARLEPVPRLAEKWQISPDGKVLTFHLRKNVTWQDGQPFTARDVEFTFEAIRTTEAESTWKGYMASVDKLEVPDDNTVVVTYKHSYAPALTTWTVGILPKHVYGQGDLLDPQRNTEPVGTGPYKLMRWEVGKRLLLQANTTWWYGRPHIDTIELVVDVPPTLDALVKGDIDFARIEDIGEWINRAQAAEFRDTFEVSDVVEAHFRVIAWNTQRPALADKRVRQGLGHALNRARVVDDVLLGLARPISGPFFPNMYGLDPSVAPLAFDTARAGQLFDEAGFPLEGGQRFSLEIITLEAQENPVTNGTMGMFRDDLRALGIDLQIAYLPVREFFERIKTRNFDGAYFGWLPDIPDPDPYALLHSSMIGAGSNYAGYSNPELDALLEAARAATTRDERKAAYYKIHRLVHEEQPYAVLYAPYGHYAWSRRMRGVNPNDIGGQPRFPGVARWWVTPPGAAPETAAKLAPR